MLAAACRNEHHTVGVEDCANNLDDDDNGLVDCRDPVCADIWPCNRVIDGGFAEDAGTPDAGAPDAGPIDAGTIVYGNACPGAAYVRTCGPDAGSGWRKVLPRATDSLFVGAWAAPDAGDVFIGGHTVFRWTDAGLVDELPDAGLYVVRIEGRGPYDLWALTAETNDGARLLHRIPAGWFQEAFSKAVLPSDFALADDGPWLLFPDAVGRAVDGGFQTWPLPPQTAGLFLSADPNGELWIGGSVTPCPGYTDGGMCPRVVHGVPGNWVVDDWPCRGGASAAHVWRRNADERVVTGGGFIARYLDGGWTQPESTTFSGARMAGTANDAWIVAYDLLLGSQASGVAHFNGCVEQPIWLYSTRVQTNAANGITYSVTSSDSAWAVGSSWDSAQQRWRGELFVHP